VGALGVQGVACVFFLLAVPAGARAACGLWCLIFGGAGRVGAASVLNNRSSFCGGWTSVSLCRPRRRVVHVPQPRVCLRTYRAIVLAPV